MGKMGKEDPEPSEGASGKAPGKIQIGILIGIQTGILIGIQIGTLTGILIGTQIGILIGILI